MRNVCAERRGREEKEHGHSARVGERQRTGGTFSQKGARAFCPCRGKATHRRYVLPKRSTDILPVSGKGNAPEVRSPKKEHGHSARVGERQRTGGAFSQKGARAFCPCRGKATHRRCVLPKRSTGILPVSGKGNAPEVRSPFSAQPSRETLSNPPEAGPPNGMPHCER